MGGRVQCGRGGKAYAARGWARCCLPPMALPATYHGVASHRLPPRALPKSSWANLYHISDISLTSAVPKALITRRAVRAGHACRRLRRYYKTTPNNVSIS